MEKNKFTSRKFLLCLAMVLTGIGNSIAGMCFDNEWIVFAGIACTAVGTAIYTICEAWIDKAAVKVPVQTAPLPTDEEIDAQII